MSKLIYKPLLKKEICHLIIQNHKNSPLWKPSETISDDINNNEREAEILSFNKTEDCFKTLISDYYKPIKEMIYSKYKVTTGELDTFDIVRYYENGYYIAHKDSGPEVEQRMFTVLIYLNDNFSGGETYIHDENKSIRPIEGNILIFPSEYLHEACVVKHGSKLILLTWYNSIN